MCRDEGGGNAGTLVPERKAAGAREQLCPGTEGGGSEGDGFVPRGGDAVEETAEIRYTDIPNGVKWKKI